MTHKIGYQKKLEKIPKNQVLEGKISWGRGNTWANGTMLVLLKSSWWVGVHHVWFDNVLT
jgi:hypothetical protein